MTTRKRISDAKLSGWVVLHQSFTWSYSWLGRESDSNPMGLNHTVLSVKNEKLILAAVFFQTVLKACSTFLFFKLHKTWQGTLNHKNKSLLRPSARNTSPRNQNTNITSSRNRVWSCFCRSEVARCRILLSPNTEKKQKVDWKIDWLCCVNWHWSD